MHLVRRFVLASAVVAAVPAAPARADVRLRYMPEWSQVDTHNTDSAGQSTDRTDTTFTHRFLGDVDQKLFPLLQLNLNGVYERNVDTFKLNGVPGEADTQRWNVAGTLKAGDRILNGGVNYLRSEQSGRGLTGAVPSTSPARINESYGAFGAWAPPELPRLDLRVSRTNLYDSTKTQYDLVTDSAGLNAIYATRRLDTSYRFLWSDSNDHIGGTESSAVANTGFLAYHDQFLDNRITTAASYQLLARTSDTKTTRPGGIVNQQVVPPQGLSGIERAPATPTRITLDPNSGLVDGEISAGVGIDIGFGPTLGGDLDYRDVGAQFVNAATPVDAVYVYVDRQLPTTLVSSWTWQAYQSDDNVTWTQVTVTGPATFGAFQNRFEIPIQRTQARYLKVITRPLAANVTTDSRWRNVLVTEIQFVENLPAASLAGSRTTYAGMANASLRLKLLQNPNLYYEFSALLNHTSERHLVTWDVTNGLMLDKRLTSALTVNARVDRTDTEGGGGLGHETTTRYATNLTAQPLPAAMASIGYAGQRRQGAAGTAITNTILAFARADPYRGVSLGGNASYGFGTSETGRNQRSQSAQGSVSLVPNRVLSLNSAYTYSTSTESGAGQATATTTSQRIDATAVLTPVPMVQASVTEAHIYALRRWYDLLTLAGSVSLLHGGDLVATFTYNESIDTSEHSRTRTFGPGLRWSFRAGAYVDLSYSQLDSTTPALVTRSTGVFARLFIPVL